MKNEEFVKIVKEYLSENETSQASLSQKAGVNPSVLSSIISNDYKGDTQRYTKQVLNYIKKSSISKELIDTTNMMMAKMITTKAYEHNAMAVICGKAGAGKSESCKSICKSMGNGIYIECDAYITTRGLFGKITKALGITGKRGLSDTLEVICEYLKHQDIVLFVDEAEYLQHKTLEMLRRIWDFSNTSIIFVGTEIIVENLKRHTQLYSRIQYKWEFKPLDFEETKQICQRYNNSIDDSEIKYILKLTKYSFRSTVFLIENAFDLAKTNETTVTRKIVDLARDTLLL
jgi:DNA transposition AAA+ family ATPase